MDVGKGVIAVLAVTKVRRREDRNRLELTCTVFMAFLEKAPILAPAECLKPHYRDPRLYDVPSDGCRASILLSDFKVSADKLC
jgi:hypothetical protein